eukprot:sb/3463263/
MAICQNYSLCADEYQNICVDAEVDCRQHKNHLCDGAWDCDNGGDEMGCGDETLEKMCVRRVNQTAGIQASIPLPIPMSWVMDGVRDCEDGVDETESEWLRCDVTDTLRFYVEPREGVTCEKTLICPNEEGFIKMSELCDRINTCSFENELCDLARRQPDTWNTIQPSFKLDHKILPHCFKGMDEWRTRFDGDCEGKIRERVKAFGVTDIEIMLPVGRTFDCSHHFGENYVYLACMGMCNNNISCPIDTSKQSHDSCANLKDSSVYSIRPDNQMTLLERVQRFGELRYYDDHFLCDNGDCIPFEKVCNLVNDCGDGSDEDHCINNFRCGNSEGAEYIPISYKCDKQFDCDDYGDECNVDCGDREILERLSLKVVSWAMGGFSVLFNTINIVKNLGNWKRIKLYRVAMTSLMVLLIAFGDLLMGVYLLWISIKDALMGEQYCRDRFKWLISDQCAALGVISTAASQLSLFAMTFFSMYRLETVTLKTNDRLTINAVSSRVRLSLVVVIVVSLSLFIALVPLVTAWEDVFVNGLFYEGIPLFTASVTKTKHYDVMRGYHGRFSTDGNHLPWEDIRYFVNGMFNSTNKAKHTRTD